MRASSERAYRALKRLMGQADGDRGHGDPGASFNSGGTGFWSQPSDPAPGYSRDSDESSGSSRLWDKMESKGKCRISLATMLLLHEFSLSSDLVSIKMIAESSRIHF